jgi:hypothetical protein
MKMSSAPSFGAPGSLIVGVAHQKLKNITFYQSKLGLGLAYPQKPKIALNRILFFILNR